MTQQTQAYAAVRHSVTVPLEPQAAFELFTERFAEWWPLESHHILEGDAGTAVMEPRKGGRWYEVASDGRECDWGRVRAFEPPNRVLLGWHLSPEWKFDPDPATATEVEVTFEPEDGGTRVTLEHRGFEVLGEPGAALRDQVASEGGWSTLLDDYAKFAVG